MRFTDSHCHLTMSDAVGSLERARAQGVEGFVVPATKLEDAPQAIAIARQHDDVWAAVGFHPHEASHCDDAAFAEIEAYAADEQVVAIGEIGLDFHYMHSSRETQLAVLERHIELARRTGKPVIIHNRQSTALMVETLERARVPGIVHSFTENGEVAKKLVDLGYYISFSGIVTFRTAETLR